MNADGSTMTDIWSQIIDVSPHHVMDMQFESLGGSGRWKVQEKRTLRFFLLKDLLEIRRSDATTGKGIISRLARQFFKGGDGRPFKHVADVLLTELSRIYYVNAGELVLLVLAIRADSNREEELVLLPQNESIARDFVTSLSLYVFLRSGRDISATKLELHETSDEVWMIVKKMLIKQGLALTAGTKLVPQTAFDSAFPLGRTTSLRGRSNLMAVKKMNEARARAVAVGQRGENVRQMDE